MATLEEILRPNSMSQVSNLKRSFDENNPGTYVARIRSTVFSCASWLSSWSLIGLQTKPASANL